MNVFTEFFFIFFFFSFCRSPALKPLWLSLSGSDTESLFSSLFRKFFCNESRLYLKALAVAKKTNRDKVIPAFLWHIKELAFSLQQPQHSSLIVMEVKEASEDTKAEKAPINAPVVKVIMNWFIYEDLFLSYVVNSLWQCVGDTMYFLIWPFFVVNCWISWSKQFYETFGTRRSRLRIT